MQNNQAYFTQREAQERSAASRSKGKARAAHEEMADRYHDLAEEELSPPSAAPR